MKVFENDSQAQGFNTESKLELGDDGRFSYEESWKDYTNVALYGGAEGRWRQGDGAVIFHTERVHGDLPLPFEGGQELRAVEQGDTLVVPDWFKLRVPPERKEDVPIRNTGRKPLTVRLEPWGVSHVVAPGEQVRVVARGPGGMGQLEVVRGADEIVVYGWSESQVAVVREPKPEPADPARPPRAARAEPAVAPPPPPVVPTRVIYFPRFEPRTPSPELAARIRRWVEELPTEGMQDWIARLCKENDAIPLHCTQIYLWALRADGQVLCIDHESSSRRAERETNAVTAYAALAQGAHDYPELAELRAHNPEGVRECERCRGKGWTRARPPEQGTDSCHWCDGMGWHEPRPPR